MQKIKKTIEVPRLKITYDEYIDSPREWDNLGYFITSDRHYQSPDGKKYPEIQAIVEDTQHDADNQAHHVQLITDAINATGETVKVIYPVVKYEHSGVSYTRGTVHDFDYSNNGFYIVTDKSQAVCGTPDESIEKMIDGELETYTSYANGEIYEYVLYDNNGEVEEACGGFYDIDDMRECLPESFKDEDLTDYLVY